MEKQRIGIAGIGLMGHGIARNILKGGWQLVCLDHPGNQPVEDLLGAGATLAATGRDLADQCDIIIVCVTGSPQVEDPGFVRANGRHFPEIGQYMLDRRCADTSSGSR